MSTMRVVVLQVFVFVLCVTFVVSFPNINIRNRRDVNECGPPVNADDIHRAATRASEFLMSKKSEITHGWPHTPSAIMAQQLFNPMWFNDNDLSPQLSVKQMDVELLAHISHRRAFSDWNRIDFRRDSFGGGGLAYYILALQATCQDPRDYYGHDLMALLENKMENEEFSNYFSYSLGILAQCHAGVSIPDHYINRLTDVLADFNVQYSGDFDTLVLSLIALKCVRPDSLNMRERISDGLADLFLYESNRDENSVESSAMAIQLLIVLEDELAMFTGNMPWCMGDLFQHLLSEQREDGSFHGNAMSTSQILTVLARKTLMDIPDVTCYRSTEEVIDILQPNPNAPEITFTLSIYDEVAIEDEPAVIHSYEITIHNGTSLFQVLQMMNELGEDFSFEYTDSAWGPYITSIMGIPAGVNTYWSIQQSDEHTNTGVGEIFPHKGDSYLFKHVRFHNAFI